MLWRTLALRGLLVAGLGLVSFGCGQLPRPDYLRQTMVTKQNANSGIWETEEEPPAEPKRDTPRNDRSSEGDSDR